MKKYIYLILICTLFLFTRLYKISSIPASVYWDEASIGYNAYSISIDGMDEWGSFLPLHFRAFGEFKLPVYIYSVAPFVKVLGLNALSVRLPAVIFSFASLILIYLLAKKLFEDEKTALLSAFLFTVLPWMFLFSRAGYEASAGVFFYLLGTYFFVSYFILTSAGKVFKRYGTSLLYSIVITIVFVASVYSYNSFRIISPLTLAFLILFLLFKQRKHIYKLLVLGILSLTIIAISYIPIYRLYRYDAGASRLQVVSLQGTTKQKILQFSKNYLSHYSYKFLFTKGDANPRSQISGFGQLYLLSLPFLLIGLVVLIKKRNFSSLLIIFILAISPIPAALTKESPHALRSISFVVICPLIIALGIGGFRDFFKSNSKTILSLVILAFILNFSYYFYYFISNYNRLYSQDWQYGDMVLFADKQTLLSNAGRVVVSDEYAQPYIFALFYQSYPPSLFRSQVVLNSPDKWGFSKVSAFDKYTFKKIEDSDFNFNTLLVDSKVNPTKGNCSKEIVFLNGKLAYCIYD
jgi:4-amino-4-deoxy-L-arabinose transferase-like glycosyltransferase